MSEHMTREEREERFERFGYRQAGEDAREYGMDYVEEMASYVYAAMSTYGRRGLHGYDLAYLRWWEENR